MNIGDKVRFLNDVGGGKITAIRPGGIVLVEDADGFDIPVRQDEVVVIEGQAPKPAETKKPAPKVEYGRQPATAKEGGSLDGREYLKSKTVSPAQEEAEAEVDEQLEARVVRLELAVQKLEARIARLEAENNLRKNERHLHKGEKKSPRPAPSLQELQIL